MHNILDDIKKNVVVTYVPHGIDSEIFKPIEVPDEFKKSILGSDADKYEFIIFWNNRNIRRKQPVDLLFAFKSFVEQLPKDKQDKVCLLMHTNPVDDNGTNLPAILEQHMPNVHVYFSNSRCSDEDLNKLYNIADITINIASNEGFGLATAESVMAGTPIIVTVTGGLQDQCGFKFKNIPQYIDADDYIKIGSLHNTKQYKHKVEHGVWVKPLWPVRSATGSIPTPYIFDDRVDFEDVADAMMAWYQTPKEERTKAGLEGRRWMMNEGKLNKDYMCQSLIDGIEATFAKVEKRKKYQFIKI